MCDEFNQNRKALVDIIYSKEDFTESEIIEAYRKKMGHLIVDAAQSITGYLKDLRDAGALGYWQGHYYVK